MKRLIVGVVVCVVMIAWAVRFTYVNKEFSKKAAVDVHYPMGEIVHYGRDFFNRGDEDYLEYSIVVKKAKRYSFDEFVRLHRLELPTVSEYTFRPDYVYDLEVTVFNAGNDHSRSGIDMFNTLLIHQNIRMPVHIELWEALYPQLTGSLGFRVRPGTQMDFHFPFTLETPSSQTALKGSDLRSRPFVLTLSRYPRKRMIDIVWER